MFLKNTAGQYVSANLVSKTDGSAVTTGTTTVYATKDNGSQTSLGSATHKGNGEWIYALADTDTNANSASYTFVNTSACNVTVNVYPTALNDIADALLKRDMSAVTGEASRSLLNALRKLRNKWSISGSTVTYTKEDDSTSAFTSSVTTSGGAVPIIAEDPS